MMIYKINLLIIINFLKDYYIMLQIILLYTCIVALIAFVKPKFIFQEDGNLKEFGFEEHETIFPFHVLTLVIALILFTLYVLFRKKEN